MGQTVNSHWTTNAREHSPDFREHPRIPGNHLTRPKNQKTRGEPLTTQRAQAQGERMFFRLSRKRRKRKRKRYVFQIIKDSHWERLLTWASEHNRRYPYRPTEAREEEGNSKDKTTKTEADTLYRRGPTLLCPQYPYRYRY